MLAAIGEFERDLIRERSAEWIARAKANGVKFGVESKLTDEEIAELCLAFAAHEVDRQTLARQYGISRSTVYRL
jgi:DNA invertase Pin-like site-specific DNA recombinase